MSIENFPDADLETISTIMAVFEELLRLCPADPTPLLKVKAKEHISAYDPDTNTVYICVAPDSYLPIADELLEEIPRPDLWSGLLSEIIEEYVHSYQASIQGELPSPRAAKFWQRYYKPSWGEGHGEDFFEAIIRFARALNLDDEAVVKAISR
jgi:hypothetical protein